MGLEEFKPYKRGLNVVHVPRDIPASLRMLDNSAQEFWLRHAAPRNPWDLYYGAFSWADMERSLRQEACGKEDSLFGKFDFSDSASLGALRSALEELAGGQLPQNAAGEAVVPPKVFAALVQVRKLE